jgi:hypothetical protein
MSVYSFVNTNHRARWTDFDDEIQISFDQWKRELTMSAKSGLIPDLSNNIYVREGYGALVGWCPDNCSTLKQLFNYTKDDKFLEVAGSPNLKELLLKLFLLITRGELFEEISYRMLDLAATIISGEKIEDDDYFGYKKKVIEEGMDLVIGPGGYVEGDIWDKAVYCRNYKQVLGIPEAYEVDAKTFTKEISGQK